MDRTKKSPALSVSLGRKHPRRNRLQPFGKGGPAFRGVNWHLYLVFARNIQCKPAYASVRQQVMIQERQVSTDQTDHDLDHQFPLLDVGISGQMDSCFLSSVWSTAHVAGWEPYNFTILVLL